MAEEKRSWLDKVQGAIWEDTKPAAPAPAAQSPVTAPISSGVPTSPVATYSTVNQDMVKAIKANTLSRKTPYTALLEAADKLANVIPDPITRMKAAYAMVGEQRTVDAIMKAIDIHVSDVDGEKLRFTQSTEQKRTAELGSLKQQASQLAASTDQMQKEIVSLQERIQMLSGNVTTNITKGNELDAQISARNIEFDTVARDFELAAQTVRNELEQQRVAVTSTLSS